jgi:toxin ParE1/3/4
MIPARFHPDAEQEFMAAVEYYESRQGGLGLSFAAEVLATVRNLLAFPTVWPVLEGAIRRCLTPRFPFGVLYSVELDGVFILAVMDLRRQPDYWKERFR